MRWLLENSPYAVAITLLAFAVAFVTGPSDYELDKLMEKALCEQAPRPKWCKQ